MAEEYVPIYYESAERAFSKGPQSEDAIAYRNSLNATEKCINDLEACLYGFIDSRDTFRPTADDVLSRHGIERVNYVLATYVAAGDRAGEFSEETKAWAKGIKISSSFSAAYAVRLDDKIDIKDIETLIKTVNEKDAERYAAQEKNKEAEEEKMNGKVTKNEDGSITVTMPGKAVIRRYDKAAALCMPRGRGYDLYRFIVDMKDLKDNGDGTVTVRCADPDLGDGTNGVTLTIKRRGEEKTLSPEDIQKIFSGARDEDYEPRMYDVEIPKDAMKGNFPNMARATFPEDSNYSRQHVVLPLAYRDEKRSTEDRYVFSVPDYMNFSVRDGVGDKFISAEELSSEFSGGSAKKRAKWTEAEICHEAFIHTYDRSTLFKMPVTGDYKGYAYYMPNGMIVNPEEAFAGGDFKIRLPETKTVDIKNNRTGDKKTLDLKGFLEAVQGKGAEDYKNPPAQGVDTKTEERKPEKKTGPDEGSGK